MSLPTELSLECNDCHVYNLRNGIIEDSIIYCKECYVKRHLIESVDVDE